MKDKLIKLRDLIDAKSLRDRIVMFFGLAAVIVYVVYVTLLSPLYEKQTKLRAQINQQNNNMRGLDEEISATLLAYQRDPDLPAKARLAALRAESLSLTGRLATIQSNLVAPEQMAPMLESILGKNKNLRLLSLNNLPPVAIKEAASAPAAPANGSAAPSGAVMVGNSIYRHGVELSVSGNYLDMVEYMRALENMPSRLYWGKAQLDVQEYPTARLTLTLYTLSLDKKWMTM